MGVGERQIRVIASDATPDRMGDILEPIGCDLSNYRRNPIVLAQHYAAEPIARCSTIGIEGGKLVATIDFPPPGVGAKSDLYLGLMKANVIAAVSVGFVALEWEPIRGAGLRYTRSELLKLSCVSVPSNPSALVTERSAHRRSTDEKPLGNCGRPIGRECGLVNVAEWQIHGICEIGFGDGDAERAVRLRRARAIRRRLALVPEHATREDRERLVAEIRAAHDLTRRVSPAVQVAVAAFRLGCR